MSNRDSLGFGDLLPQDVVEVFAQEKHSKRRRKKRSNSLGRALGWLKGKKRKDLGANGQSLGLGPALDLALDGHPAGHQGGHRGGQKSGKQSHSYGNSHAALKRDNDNEKAAAPPLLQENVFIETSRPKYLEDLHTEALEGLKLMQQEEINNGVEFQDNESTISTLTVKTDGDGGGFMTDSTIPDTSSVVSVQSSVSTRSSRSGLTRQGSTFRPLNSGKKSDKARRGRHRKTVGGIPQHVRREMGLDRVDWALTQRFDEEQLYNGETDNSTTSDGPESPGTSAGLQNIKIIRPLNKAQIEQLSVPHAGHRDELALLHRLGPGMSDEQRPRSLAVPWMTTANSLQQELPSPVMSMSPQAAYMSKIIPNAVLPPSIEVVEISRGRSRSSLRTVSKSSLLLSSPAPSRASSRASSSRTTSSRVSTITSASRHNPPHLSDSSGWSNSESSDTLVSDSSTISSSTTPRQKRSQDGDAYVKEDKVGVKTSIKASKHALNGKVLGKMDEAKKDGQFVRSLSVMKPKRAPPPPSRSYSLHNKMKRRSRDLQDIRIISGESSPKRISREANENKSQHSSVVKIDSPSYHADTSSLDDSTGSGSFSPFKSQLKALKEEKAAMVEETTSKDASQEKQDNKLSKVISPSSGYSSQDAISPHSSSPRPKKGLLAKLQRLFPSPTSAGSVPSPEKTKTTGDLKNDLVDTANVSPSVRTLRDLFNIPPPPKVHAPPPPPPEVWAHSKRSVELLLGPPVPENLYAIIKKNPKDRRPRQSPPASTEGSVKSLVTERKHKAPAITVESVNGSVLRLETKMVQESGLMHAEIHKENRERLVQNVDLKGNIKMTEKDKVGDVLNGVLVKAVEKYGVKQDAKKMSTHATDVKPNVDTLPAISFVRISQSPSPSSSAEHKPLHLLTKQSPEVKVASGQTVVSPESSWPPPPPTTMAQVGVSGPDEVDFPLPPPPVFGSVGLVIPVQVPPERSSSSQEITPPTLTIPPPPPYTAPPPPLKAASPPMTKKVFSTIKDIFPPPPEQFALPTSTEVSHPKERSPPTSTDVSPPHPHPKERSPPTSTEVSPPHPPLLATEVSHPHPKEHFPPTSTEVSPPASKEFSTPPPSEVSPVMSKESSLLVQEVACRLVKDTSPTLVEVVSPPLVEEVSPLPPKAIATESSVDATPVSMLTPPSSIPPPPPLPSQPQLSDKHIDLPQEKSKPETNTVSCNGILTPPQSIPPPPSIEHLHQPPAVPPNTDSLATQEAPPSQIPVQPTPEISQSPEKAQEPAPPPVKVPSPPPLPAQCLASIKQQPISASTENLNQELTSASNTAQKGEPAPIITPTLLQMVKLRTINGSPEPPKAQEQPQSEVTMRKHVLSNQVPTSSAGGETPQKPIRKSLIMTSPTSASPPVIITSQPSLPKSQSLVVPPASSSTVLSPMKKSPAMTAFPSMNLQEAIRLRTAVISKESPASRLSLHSPTSPIDPHKSPSSTASFIFSKSNKKLVIETKPTSDAKAAVQKNQDVSSVTKVGSVAESPKTGVKVPPPVAKKPKSKGKENESIEEMEQTAGQEGEQESNMDAVEKTNGTAGTVEEDEMALT